MTLEALVQGLVISVSTSGIYLLMALGLNLMFGIMHILNFAHGAVYMLGAFTLYYLFGLAGVSFWLAVPAAAVVAIGLGLLIERTGYRITKSTPEGSVLLFIALMWVIEAGASFAFGPENKTVPQVYHGITSIHGVTLPNERLMLLLPVTLLTLGLYILIYRTRLGLVMRAVQEDSEAASLQGVDPNKVHRFVFGLGFGMAGLAGALVSPLFVVNPYMGLTPLLKGFVIISVGGLGSVTGAVLASLLLGMMDGVVTTAIGTVQAQLLSLVLVIVVLLVRPRGLMGRF